MAGAYATPWGSHLMGTSPVSDKGRGGNDHRARSWVRAGNTTPGADEGAHAMRTSSSHPRRQTFVRRTDVRPNKETSGAVFPPAMTEGEAAKEFSALVVGFTQKDLATAADRTVPAAKHWKAGTRAPNSSSLITLARRIPKIRDWVIDQIDAPMAAVGATDEMAAVMAGLQLAANLPGQQGAIARAMLKKMQEGGW